MTDGFYSFQEGINSMRDSPYHGNHNKILYICTTTETRPLRTLEFYALYKDSDLLIFRRYDYATRLDPVLKKTHPVFTSPSARWFFVTAGGLSRPAYMFLMLEGFLKDVEP